MSNDRPPQDPNGQYGQPQYGQQPGQQPGGQWPGGRQQQHGQQQHGQQQHGQQQYGQSQYGQPQYGAPGPGQYGPGGVPPLWAPWYGIPFTRAFTRFWQKYTAFSGRASRSEYWWWALISYVVSIVLTIPAYTSLIGAAVAAQAANGSAAMVLPGTYYLFSAISGAWALATIIPNFALLFRRLHDTNKSGWWWFIGFVPFAGPIILLVFVILPPDPQGQRFDRPTS